MTLLSFLTLRKAWVRIGCDVLAEDTGQFLSLRGGFRRWQANGLHLHKLAIHVFDRTIQLYIRTRPILDNRQLVIFGAGTEVVHNSVAVWLGLFCILGLVVWWFKQTQITLSKCIATFPVVKQNDTTMFCSKTVHFTLIFYGRFYKGRIDCLYETWH